MPVIKATGSYRVQTLGLDALMMAILIGNCICICINLKDLYPNRSDPCEALKTWHVLPESTMLA